MLVAQGIRKPLAFVIICNITLMLSDDSWAFNL